jgi:hypothetical protein
MPDGAAWDINLRALSRARCLNPESAGFGKTRPHWFEARRWMANVRMNCGGQEFDGFQQQICHCTDY